MSKRPISPVSLGVTLAFGMGIFIFIGYFLDRENGGQTGAVAGMFMGLIYCGYEVWKVVRATSQNDNSDKEK